MSNVTVPGRRIAPVASNGPPNHAPNRNETTGLGMQAELAGRVEWVAPLKLINVAPLLV